MKKMTPSKVLRALLVLFAFVGVFAPVSRAEGVTKLVVGLGESYLIYRGRVYVWGTPSLSTEMKLEQPDNGDVYLLPSKIRGLNDVEDFQMGHGVSCALTRGRVKCWGEAYQKNPESFSISAPLGEVVAFGLTPEGLCVASAHRLACSGRKLDRYRLGKSVDFVSATEFVKNFSNPITQIAITTDHICVISGAKIYCGGEYYASSFGIIDPFKTPIIEGSEFVQISGAYSVFDNTVNGTRWFNQFCARTQEGTVYCWGDTDFHSGRISDLSNQRSPDQTPSFIPKKIGKFDKNYPATDVATVSSRAFAVQDGKIYYWGKPFNASNAHFDFNPKPILDPILFSGLKEVKSIAASETHVCAIASDGVYCMGINFSGELGTRLEHGTLEFVETRQKVGGLPSFTDFVFHFQDLSDAFQTLQKITVEDKSQVLMRASKKLDSEETIQFPSDSLMGRHKQADQEFANSFIVLSLAPLFNDFAAESGTEAQTDLEKVHANYQNYIHENIGIQQGITDLSVIRYSSAVASAAREVLDASLRALNGVSGEANVEAYQNLLAEVSRVQDIRSVVPLVDGQREWIENTAASNQSKRCFAQMVLNITEYLRGNL